MSRRLARICGAVLACLSAAAPAAKASGLHVIPFPGTPDASPSTQIIFSSLTVGQLRSVAVTGSLSGPHQGHLTALPASAGTAFVPSMPFRSGERVTVRAVLSSPAAGAASGEPGGTSFSFSFRVLRPASGRPPSRHQPTRARAASAQRTQSFHSAPNLHPPIVRTTGEPDRSSGDIFLTPFNSPQGGLMILGPSGRLVWFHPVPGGEAFNLQVQRYHDQPVLTWWEGPLSANHGTIYGLGEDVVADRSYRPVVVVHAGNGYTADLHEFQITPRGTAFLDAYVPVHRNLTALGGPSNGTVLDCVVQELDVRTGQVLWEWHSLGHVPLWRSYWPVPHSPAVWFDYFHINSIEELPDGNVLISSRNTWAIYKIRRSTGQVIWTLGGRRSSFTMGPRTRFEWQHDARMHPGGVLSVFDDASSPVEEPQASAKFLRLDTRTMTARLAARYTHSPPVLAGLAGNTQLLANRDVFVGWGAAPDFSEYGPGGRQIFNGAFPVGIGTYRALRFPWSAHPLTRPALAAAAAPDGGLTVYASWNGATAVARWRLLGGPRPALLHVVGPDADRTGFETAISTEQHPAYVAVQALDAGGRVLGTSRTQPG
jgi:hypothetical protein